MIAGEAREMAYGRNGQSLLLHHVKPHDLFGAIFSDETGAAPAQVTAILPTSTAQIKSSTMIQLIECYPNVAVGITRQLVRRLDETRRRVVEETMLSAAGRVCAELSRRSAATSDNIVRPMPVFADLAITVNSTRETVSRTVSKLEARGIVRRVANGLQIVALHRLDEMAV